jgi:nucleotide-binding universal stress UspA family protein
MSARTAPFDDILVHATPAAATAGDAGLAQAMALAAAHGARVTVLLYDTEAETAVTWSGVEIPMPVALPSEGEAAAAKAAAAHVSGLAAAAGVTAEIVTERSYAYGVGETFADYARVRDVAVVTLPEAREIGRRFLVEGALFHSGRPVLLVPRGGTVADFSRVVVGWDATPGAVRAVNEALPILGKAREVTLVSVNDDKTFRSGQSGVEMARHLAHRGIPATFAEVKRHHRGIGACFAEAVADRGASLLVMGAYAHSRLRDIVFGSATRDVLNGAIPVPVLLAT